MSDNGQERSEMVPITDVICGIIRYPDGKTRVIFNPHRRGEFLAAYGEMMLKFPQVINAMDVETARKAQPNIIKPSGFKPKLRKFLNS